MWRGDDADDVGNVERGRGDLVQLRREGEDNAVAAAAAEIDRLLHGRDADHLGLLGRGWRGEYANTALVIRQELLEVVLRRTPHVSAREFNDRRAGAQVEEHRDVAELKVQVDQYTALAVRGESGRDVGRQRGRSNAALAVRERDDHAELAGCRDRLGGHRTPRLSQDRLDLCR